MSATLDDDQNPRAFLGAKDVMMCWNCGFLQFHESLWCISCYHGQGDGGDLRMRLGVHELILAAYTDVPGAREIIDEIEASGG